MSEEDANYWTIFGDSSGDAASSPIVTNPNGTSSAGAGFFDFLNNLTKTAAQTYTSVNGQTTQNQIAQRQTQASTTNAMISSQSMIYIALAAAAIGLGMLFLSRRKA